MNPRGRLGHFWDRYLPIEFRETLAALQWKMEEIAAGRQRYSEEQERRFSEQIPRDLVAYVLREQRELAMVELFLMEKLDWLVRG